MQPKCVGQNAHAFGGKRTHIPDYDVVCGQSADVVRCAIPSCTGAEYRTTESFHNVDRIWTERRGRGNRRINTESVGLGGPFSKSITT